MKPKATSVFVKGGSFRYVAASVHCSSLGGFEVVSPRISFRCRLNTRSLRTVPEWTPSTPTTA